MKSCCRLLVWLGVLLPALSVADTPAVFPEPQEMSISVSSFALDQEVPIVGPANPSAADRRFAGLLSGELAGRHGIALRRQSAARLPAGRFILIGDIANPLVKAWCAAHQIEVTPAKPGPEGYVLQVTPAAVVIAGSDERGAFYGLQSLRQLIQSDGGKVRVPGVTIRDWPHSRFRGIKIYVPGRDHMGFFKRFVRDYMALYKFNKLIVEMNATMRLDRHPELNAGSLDLARDLQFLRVNEPYAPWFHSNNSVHSDAADGGILEKTEVADMVRWAEANYIEVIPELPSLSHSYYLLTRHREFAEIPQEEWPDTYCPSVPGVYKLLFEVWDEYIDVMKPKMIQAGHDEWRMPWGVCPRCRNKDPRELFAQDVNKIHDYLRGKGVRMAIWCDHLLENVRGVKLKKPYMRGPGYDYQIPGALSPEQVKKWIPKDILMFNWVWGYTADKNVAPITNEQRLSDWGFESVYANMFSSLQNFAGRTKDSPKIIGGEPSAWLATTEFNFGKDRIADFTLCEGMMWSGRNRPAPQTLDRLMPTIRRNLSGALAPSATDPVVPVNISAALNSRVEGAGWKMGRVSRERLVFDLADAAGGGNSAVVAGSRGSDPSAYPQGPQAVEIGQDVTSIVFLHALAKPAASLQGYSRIYAFEDSADLLGWYEIEYEDGLVTTVPLRDRWNIQEWNNQRGVLYAADTVDAGNGARLYAFEWTNPRMGKTVRRVRVNGSYGFKNNAGKTIPSNAVILAAVSIVPKREKPKRPDPPLPQ